MPRISNCAVCHGKDPHYLLTERQTGLRLACCVGCLQDTVRFLSHPQDLARALRASRPALRQASLAETRSTLSRRAVPQTS